MSHKSKLLTVLLLVFKISVACASYDREKNKVIVVKEITTKTFSEIEVYIDGMQEKLNYIKSNCIINVETTNLLKCITAHAYIKVRIERVDILLDYMNNKIQGYPEELSALKPGMQNKIIKLRALVQAVKSGVLQNSMAIDKKMHADFSKSTQKAIVDGVLQGKTHYYCVRYSANIELFKEQIEKLKNNDSGFSGYYQKYDEVVNFLILADLFKSVCTDKIDLVKGAALLKGLADKVTDEKVNSYFKEQCVKLKDQELKQKCLKTGIKRVDLLYTLFSLEGSL